MASSPLNCSGCRENSSSQRDHRCLLPRARDEILHLMRVSEEAMEAELIARETRPFIAHEYVGYDCRHCGTNAFSEEAMRTCPREGASQTTTDDT